MASDRLYSEKELPATAQKLYFCKYAAKGVVCPESSYGSACSYPQYCRHTSKPENAKAKTNGSRMFKREANTNIYFEV